MTVERQAFTTKYILKSELPDIIELYEDVQQLKSDVSAIQELDLQQNDDITLLKLNDTTQNTDINNLKSNDTQQNEDIILLKSNYTIQNTDINNLKGIELQQNIYIQNLNTFKNNINTTIDEEVATTINQSPYGYGVNQDVYIKISRTIDTISNPIISSSSTIINNGDSIERSEIYISFISRDENIIGYVIQWGISASSIAANLNSNGTTTWYKIGKITSTWAQSFGVFELYYAGEKVGDLPGCNLDNNYRGCIFSCIFSHPHASDSILNEVCRTLWFNNDYTFTPISTPKNNYTFSVPSNYWSEEHNNYTVPSAILTEYITLNNVQTSIKNFVKDLLKTFYSSTDFNDMVNLKTWINSL